MGGNDGKEWKTERKVTLFFSKSNIWKVNFSNKQKIVSLRDTHTFTRAYAHARAFQQRCCFFAVTSVTQPMLKRRKTLSSNSNHTAKQRLVLPKTTCHFIKNNVSFYQKQRVVFQRMSALNDTQVAHQWKTQPSEELFHNNAPKTLQTINKGVQKSWFSTLLEKSDTYSVKGCYINELFHYQPISCSERCDTCDSKKAKTPVMRARAHAWEEVFIVILTQIGH